MDQEHKDILDYQIQVNRCNFLNQVLTFEVMSTITDVPISKLIQWNPYSNIEIINSIRRDILSGLSIILFDLDGYEAVIDENKKRNDLYSLIEETQASLTDAIVGVPETFVKFKDGVESNFVSIDVFSGANQRIEIPIDEWDRERKIINYKSKDSNFSRIRSLCFSHWKLEQRTILVKAFVDFIHNKNYSFSNSWIQKKLSTVKNDTIEETIDKEMLKEIIIYVNQLKNKPFLEMESTSDLEELLLGIGNRTLQ